MEIGESQIKFAIKDQKLFVAHVMLLHNITITCGHVEQHETVQRQWEHKTSYLSGLILVRFVALLIR